MSDRDRPADMSDRDRPADVSQTETDQQILQDRDRHKTDRGTKNQCSKNVH